MFRKIALTVAFVAFAGFAAAQQQTPPAPSLPPTMSLAPGPAIGVTGVGTPVIVQAAPDYTFKAGDVVASILNWVWVAFGGTFATLGTALLVRGLNYIGVQTTQQQRDKLQDMVTNGLNKAAAAGQVAAQGREWDVKIKNQVVADTIEYVKAHGPDTLKSLGLDPASPENVAKINDAIKARIETAIVDDNTPTNPNVGPGITASTTIQPNGGLSLSTLTKTTT